MSHANGNGQTVWLVYRYPEGGWLHGDLSTVCSIWNAKVKAEQYIKQRIKNGRGMYEEGKFEYGIVPWRVSV